MEKRVLRATIGGIGEVDAIVRFNSAPPWRVEVTTPAGDAAAEAEDLFYALLDVRRILDPLGVRLCCNGARLDVWPSGLAGQMSGGRTAYLLPSGRQTTREDLVDIFDPAPCSAVGSVDEQSAKVRAHFGR